MSGPHLVGFYGQGKYGLYTWYTGYTGKPPGSLNKGVAEYDLFFERSPYCVEDGCRETI